MDFRMDEIPQEILDEQQRQQEEIIAAYQDLRNRIITVEKEGVSIGPIKMKMLEAKPLIEENKIHEAALVKEKCEKMLITCIKYRDILDKLGAGKKTVDRSRKLGVDLKRYHMILTQAEDLMKIEEPETALEMIKIVQDELDRLRNLHDEAFEQLIKVQKTLTEAREAGMDITRYDKKFKGMVNCMDEGDFGKTLRMSFTNVFPMQNEVREKKAKDDIEDFRERLYTAEEQGLVIKRERKILKDMEKAVEEGNFITFETLKKHMENSIDLGNQYRNRVEEALKQTRRKLRQLRENGIWDELVMDIFEQAEDAMKDGDYAFVGECVHYIEPDVKKMTKLAEKQGISLNKVEAVELLGSTKELLRELEDMEVNTRNFKQALSDADELFSKKDYDLLVNLLQPINKQMANSREKALEKLRNEVFTVLKKVNGRIAFLKDEGIGLGRFDETMDEVQELIDDGDFRNSWALLDGLDTDTATLSERLETFNSLLPGCRERYETLAGSDGFDDVEDEYDSIFHLKRKGDLEGAIKKAREFIKGPDVGFQEPSTGFTPGVQPPVQPGTGYQGGYAATPGAQFEGAGGEVGPHVQREEGYGGETQWYSGGENDYSEAFGTGYQNTVQSGEAAYPGGGVDYYCSRCNSVLQYVPDYEAWWCGYCQRYEGE